MKANRFSRYFPILDWLQDYTTETFVRDALAAVIVTLMLVPQALAYAMLAGLPAEVGLYASMIPLVVYALFGTSATLAVGPVAVASLMTASALGGVAKGVAGICGRRPRPGDALRPGAFRYGVTAAWIPGQFPEPPGYFRLCNCFRHPDRCQPGWKDSWHR